MYTYIENITDTGMTFSVGFYKTNATSDDNWLPDITVNTRQEAAERVSYLNGGQLPTGYKELNYIVVCHNNRMPRLVGVPNTGQRMTDRVRKVLSGYNSDMPKSSKHLARVYHLQWKHGMTPIISDFMAEDLDSQTEINPIKLPPMESKDIHWKEIDV